MYNGPRESTISIFHLSFTPHLFDSPPKKQPTMATPSKQDPSKQPTQTKEEDSDLDDLLDGNRKRNILLDNTQLTLY